MDSKIFIILCFCLILVGLIGTQFKEQLYEFKEYIINWKPDPKSTPTPVVIVTPTPTTGPPISTGQPFSTPNSEQIDQIIAPSARESVPQTAIEWLKQREEHRKAIYFELLAAQKIIRKIPVLFKRLETNIT